MEFNTVLNGLKTVVFFKFLRNFQISDIYDIQKHNGDKDLQKFIVFVYLSRQTQQKQSRN